MTKLKNCALTSFFAISFYPLICTSVTPVHKRNLIADNAVTNDCNIFELNNKTLDAVQQFGSVFNELHLGLKLLEKNERKSINTVMFIGNTGVGKSTLVQLLSGDNKKLLSKETNPDSSDFIITDNDKIGTDTITSKTLYPNLLTDSKTGIILCDNPGFADTRSPIHELIAAASLKTVWKFSENIKLVLVIPYSSVQVGSYRSDFTNLLEHTVDLIKDIDKFKNSIYLVATKAENSVRFKNGVFETIPDENLINGVCNYLNLTKFSLETKDFQINNTALTNSIKIIDTLIADNECINKIKLFRKPIESGPIMNIEYLQNEREVIREALLSNKNFTKIDENDFGFSLSDTARVYANELYFGWNEYIIALSKQLSEYLLKYYDNYLNSINSIERKLTELFSIKSEIIFLSNELGRSENPKAFLNAIKNFLISKNINYNCNFTNISILNEYISNLDNFSNYTKYTPLQWNSSFILTKKFITTKIEKLNYLKDAFNILTSYTYQKQKVTGPKKSPVDSVIENDVNTFLRNSEVKQLPNDLKLDGYFLEMFNQEIYLTTKLITKIYCSSSVLHIEGFIVKLSEIDDSYIEKCNDLRYVSILAMHTLYIDKSLDNNSLKGKQIYIIAPTWKVIGSQKISVEGLSDKKYISKAGPQEVGRNGKTGGNGGQFFGVGELFENCQNLLINANGGDGQNGGDGGDGKDGSNGSTGTVYDHTKYNDKIYAVYNKDEKTVVYRGTDGTPGSDSGAGGKGGKGGQKGKVILQNVGKRDSKIQIEMKNGNDGRKGQDGTPGIGGWGGCDTYHTERTHYALFFRVRKIHKVSSGNCRGKKSNGKVRYSSSYSEVLPSFYSKELNICHIIDNYVKVYNEQYQSQLYDHKFEAFKKLVKTAHSC